MRFLRISLQKPFFRQYLNSHAVHLWFCFFAKTCLKDNLQKLGTLPLTVQKILQKILETKDAFVFRPVNALDFYNILKMNLLKIPKMTFSEN